MHTYIYTQTYVCGDSDGKIFLSCYNSGRLHSKGTTGFETLKSNDNYNRCNQFLIVCILFSIYCKPVPLVLQKSYASAFL